MSKLSLILNVYNESDMLEFLPTILNHVDDAVIIEGGAIGASVDDTYEKLQDLQRQYPFIKLRRGVFRREDDGGYNQSVMKNLMLEESTSNHVMYHHSDIIYDNESMISLRESIDRFPGKAIYYAPMQEFIYDMAHIRLYQFNPESMLPRPLCGDVPIYSKQFEPFYFEKPTIGLHFRKQWDIHDTLYLPDLRRYHLCFVRAFPHQVEKHVRRICQRDWGDLGEKLLLEGFDVVFDWAVKHAESYPQDGSKFEYSGKYIDCLRDKNYCAFDGREEFCDNFDKYKERFSAYYQPEYYHSDHYTEWSPG